MDQSKCINYFIVNGTKYYTGTAFKIKYMGEIVEAVFVCTYLTKYTEVVYKIKGKRYFTPISIFTKNFVNITNAVGNTIQTQVPQTKHLKDGQINGMALGWLWYIFLMALSFIFKDCIGLWILISVVFFSWRSNKIKKEGTYIEWQVRKGSKIGAND